MRVTNRLPGGNETILVVLEARHGVDALQVIDETKRPIDLVMTDLMMPQMSGRELIPELQALSKPPRVVLMSGGQTVMRRDSLPPGTGFLHKPFTVEELLQTVRATLEAKSITPT